MKVSVVTGPGQTQVLDVPKPAVGPADALVKMRACGICGSDAFYISIGGIPPRQGHTPLGHEPAGEVVEVGSDVTGIAVGDHVVINPMAAPSGIIGNGGATGALGDYLLIENAVRGTSLEIVPDHIPFEVAALNEPMAVARHGVNRPLPFGREVPPASPNHRTRSWCSAQVRSGLARPLASNPLGSAMWWSPTCARRGSRRRSRWVPTR
jgi:threonine dehydrogenase-like Zn-dependent dehydrogenase